MEAAVEEARSVVERVIEARQPLLNRQCPALTSTLRQEPTVLLQRDEPNALGDSLRGVLKKLFDSATVRGNPGDHRLSARLTSSAS